MSSERDALFPRDEGGVSPGVAPQPRGTSAARDAARLLRLFGIAVDRVGEGIFLSAGTSPRFLYVNESAARSLGYTPEELTGTMGIGDIDPSWTQEGWDRLLSELFERRRMVIESVHRTRDGRLVPVEITGNLFEFEGSLYNMAIVRDISERKAAENALREREREYRTLADNIPDFIVRWDRDLRRVYVNPAFAASCGKTPEQLVGGSLGTNYAPALQTVADSVLATLPSQIRAVLATGEPAQVEHPWHTAAGRRTIELHLVPERAADGSVATVLGIGRDITERRQLEERLRQSQKMEAVGQLAGGIAHDFNNVLAAIQMQATLLLEAVEGSPNVRAEVREILAATERASNLTRQLLTFSRRQVPRPVDLDLSETVAGLTKLLRRLLGEDIALESRFAPALPRVHADPGMMEQVLMNLAVNARDAMPAGGQLSFSLATAAVSAQAAALHPGAAPGDHVCLTVADTGCGIPAEALPRIFEPFFTTKEVGRGTGLGLATVFGIVEQHHGWIEVESVPGRGATFRVFLPAVGRPSSASAPPPADAAARGGDETVLLVEDDAGVRAATRSVLQRYGYRVLEAGTADEALRVWEREHPSIRLLLTDLVMPGGTTGRQLAQSLLARAPALKVLYTTGYSPEVVHRAMPQDGGHPLLQKPYAAGELAAWVRRALDG